MNYLPEGFKISYMCRSFPYPQPESSSLHVDSQWKSTNGKKKKILTQNHCLIAAIYKNTRKLLEVKKCIYIFAVIIVFVR